MMLIVALSFFGCHDYEKSSLNTGDTTIQNLPDKYSAKILYVDSYHEGYEWNDGITKGIVDTLNGTGVELKIFRMDTKRNTAEDFKVNAGITAKELVDSFKPDVLITSDDNAFKYLVMPYFKDSDLPIVFCGLNWDASIYGAPYKNTAGMVEVALLPKLLSHLNSFSDGQRIGYLAADVLTERKEGEYYVKLFNLTLNEKYVLTMDDWKKAFLEIQESSDLFIIGNNAGINDWNETDARQFVLENTKIPTGAMYEWMAEYSLIGVVKIAEEQGEWAAKTAIRILDGEKPSNIPVTTNKQGKLILNLEMAEMLGVTFSPSLLKNAEIIN